MKIGFTGTHLGMGQMQQERLRELLIELKATELHHGDCIGADAQAHAIADKLDLDIIVHPPTDHRKRAWVMLDWNVYIGPEFPYLERNKHIVEACDLLVAAPLGDEILRSGTWSTVRYARKLGRQLIILEP